jgi:hypothetical protein
MYPGLGVYAVTEHVDSVVQVIEFNISIDQSIYYIEHYMFRSWVTIVRCLYIYIYIYEYIKNHKYIAIYC